jgi:phytoene dehydrogenase-like protein
LTEEEQATLANRAITQFSQAIGEDLSKRITTRHIFGPQDFETQFNAWQFNAFGGESHILRQSVIFRTQNKSRKVKNLYYVGAGTLPGIGLPMCLIGAQLTYKRITNDKSAGPLNAGDL